ncbi:hypothetical protein HC928_20165 [bacterium]|nr:hypothetical protein [bacterium]
MQLVLNDGDAALGADEVEADDLLVARLEGEDGVAGRGLGAGGEEVGGLHGSER